MHKYYESRKMARERWRKTEHGKKWTQEYMRKYRARPYVKAKYHEYYVKNKMCWGNIKENDILNADNTERFIEDAQG